MATEKRLIDANALLNALGYDPMKFWAITPESTFGIVLNAPPPCMPWKWCMDGGPDTMKLTSDTMNMVYAAPTVILR